MLCACRDLFVSMCAMHACIRVCLWAGSRRCMMWERAAHVGSWVPEVGTPEPSSQAIARGDDKGVASRFDSWSVSFWDRDLCSF